MRVLSVDDNVQNLYLIDRLIQAHGHEVISAHNGLEALEELEKRSVDLIVSDILMPEMDGYQLCHEVKSRERTRHIPFVFYTATYTAKQDEELGLSLGASRFVLKPTDPDEFMAILKDVIREAQDDPSPAPDRSLQSPVDYLKAYNARLVQKLDRKIAQLESARHDLQLLLIARDREIAQRKRAEQENRNLGQQLAQSQKMEAIGLLAGGVAHDFNNLLTVILGYSELLRQSLSEIDPAVRQVQEISHAATRAVDLTRQLLAFSRKQVLQLANVDMNRVIRESQSMLRRLIGEDVEIRIVCAPEEMRTLVDPGQLVQVIMNLAVNARDAMPKGGVLTIETAPVEAGGTPGVQLAISDNGVGMDEDTQTRIFEPFFTTKAPGAGTGLGLSTVYGIVKQCNGQISVESEAGRGTSFRIILPRIFEQPKPAPVQSARVPAAGSETILVVEDEASLRKLAGAVLKRAGYQVIDAANGGEALLACEKSSAAIALMITDIVMPGMTGHDLAQRLALLRPRMKVLYMSGYSSHVALDRGLFQAQEHFIHKPFTPQGLVEKVRTILDQAAADLSTGSSI